MRQASVNAADIRMRASACARARRATSPATGSSYEPASPACPTSPASGVSDAPLSQPSRPTRERRSQTRANHDGPTSDNERTHGVTVCSRHPLSVGDHAGITPAAISEALTPQDVVLARVRDVRTSHGAGRLGRSREGTRAWIERGRARRDVLGPPSPATIPGAQWARADTHADGIHPPLHPHPTPLSPP